MNTFNPQSLKKLLLALGLSILIIIIFLITRVFLQEDKELEYKSFKNSQTVQEEKLKSVKEEKNRPLLLPSKE